MLCENAHDGSQMLLGEIVWVVARQDGDQVGDGAADQRIAMLVQTEDELAGALEAIAHEGFRVLQQLLYSEQASVDGFGCAHLEALFGLFVD